MAPRLGPYESFVDVEPRPPATHEIAVTIEVGSTRLERDLPRYFDAGSWRLYRDEDGLILVWPLPQRQPLWRAHLICGPRPRVRVICNDELIDERQGRRVLQNPFVYPLDQLILTLLLPESDGLLLHAAAAQAGGRVIAFAGVSGAGKSTISRLLGTSAGIERLTDDRTVLRLAPGAVRAYGTPWAGEEEIGFAGGDPLKALAFLEKGDRLEIEQLASEKGLERLLPVVSIHWFDRDRSQRTLDLCSRLLHQVPVYRLRFPRQLESAERLFELLAD